MFWGYMSGKYSKGEGLFWEKAWKTISQEHNTQYSIAYMADRGVVPIFWPPFSPDLSPIERIWDRIKDILQALHPKVHRNSRRLRAAVLET